MCSPDAASALIAHRITIANGSPLLLVVVQTVYRQVHRRSATVISQPISIRRLEHLTWPFTRRLPVLMQPASTPCHTCKMSALAPRCIGLYPLSICCFSAYTDVQYNEAAAHVESAVLGIVRGMQLSNPVYL